MQRNADERNRFLTPGQSDLPAPLPSGTVTFLFSDIEGSTRLLQQLGADYARVLADQRLLLRAAFQQRDGSEVDTQGDAFFYVFVRAADALVAAVEAQRALTRHAWPEGVTVRVRMGVHTGEPLQSGGGYVGLDVHRAARIGAAAHGGQVLLSQTARDLAEADLPSEVSLLDLGEHRLKDLQRPEHLYQLAVPDLPSDFPAPRTLDRHLHTLPVQPTALLGRDQEVSDLRGLLRDEAVRLVTLTGPGGIGKTRLGLQVAAEVGEDFADGVCFVALAAIADPALVMGTIAQAFGLRETGGSSPGDSLRSYLGEKRLLLLLDNFEQIIAAAAQVADLLAVVPRLKVLVTSREALRVRGEREYLVAPLAQPNTPQHMTPDQLSQYPAVALFIERARAVKSDFAPTVADLPTIAEICARLDGLPLAIELAAARAKLLSPRTILARLSSRLALLTSGPRDLPERQQTLRDAIGWSYDLLTGGEQRLFRRMAAFAGGCALDAVEGVCTASGDLGVDVLDALGSLVDKNLLRQEARPDEAPRFDMLETIREYGLEQLAVTGEAETTQRAHATYFLALAEQAEPHLTQAGQDDWLARLEREHGNLRAVLAWARASGDAALGLRLASALWRFWYTHGYLGEGRVWLDVMLAQPTGDGEGVADERADEPADERANEHVDERVDERARATALYGAATLASTQDGTTRAAALWEESLALFRALDYRVGVASALNALGVAALHAGDLARAASLCSESLEVSRAEGDAYAEARALLSLGQIAAMQGDYARGQALFEACLALNRQAGDKSHTAIALLNLGHVAREQGDFARAGRFYREGLALSAALDEKLRIGRGFVAIATVEAALGNAERAAWLLGAAAALREHLGAGVHPSDQPSLDRTTDLLGIVLGEEAYAAAFAAGRALPLDRAVEEALGQGG